MGVISALPEEFAHLSDRRARRSEIGGLAFWRGEIAGREAVFVESGAGKVNAGVATALLLDRFGCRALMLCGVAGGLDPALGVGDVVVGTSNIQHDYGMQKRTASTPSSPAAGPRWAATGRRAIAVADTAGGAPARGGGRARAGAAAGSGRRRPARRPSVHFGADPDRRQLRQFRAHCGGACTSEFQAHAVEMEGGAVAQVARRWGDDIPFVNVRCLSDLAGGESHLDFRAFLPVAARYASQVAHRLAPVI